MGTHGKGVSDNEWTDSVLKPTIVPGTWDEMSTDQQSAAIDAMVDFDARETEIQNHKK